MRDDAWRPARPRARTHRGARRAARWPHWPVPSPPRRAQGHRRAAAPPGRLLTYGYGNARDGLGPRTPSLARLRPAWTDRGKVISGGIYGQPLVDGKLVIVATENDKVYGLNAATGKVAWRYSVGAPARLATIDQTPTLAPGCGDISPLGITGTPVIDAAAHEVLVAAEVQDHPARPRWQNIRHVMVALKFTATSVRRAWQRPIDPPGARRHAYYIPAEQQRSALTLSRGRVYAEYGGLFGDCGKYQGYVVSAAASGTGRLRSWRVPTAPRGRHLGHRRRRQQLPAASCSSPPATRTTTPAGSTTATP